ncbi:adenosylcobinamide-GDP ribazoletransferase [Nocardia asteroides]|uniref:adenosylcobinamide-GDP ribazoletransferase n=1 Tax=Nocardia asteroides TaxID=1824 RepID=UPI001E449B68|nr:adenosylcobinamide-GDP ribazoletransferase [Nocardia asteroides]UGT65144.1 adenosylcobinamide-GDP ribazoletransferase [Nocardia asteroides]
MAGLRLALSWLTVLPVRGPDEIDRGAAGRAIAAAPVAGLLLGALGTAVLLALTAAGATASLAGLLTVGALAVGTRGMHLDGLADTADGLGCYGPPERARHIMKDGGIGPFGTAALLLAVLTQTFAFAALADDGRWAGVLLAVTTGRVAAVIACVRAPAAPDTGFGALVAATQRPLTAALWASAALAAAALLPGAAPWHGPLAVAAALTVAALLTQHCVRRFEGLSGDVLGAAVELATATTAVLLTLG